MLWAIFGIAFFLLLFILILYLFAEISPIEIITETIFKNKEQDDMEEEERRYIEKKRRQMEKQKEKVRGEYRNNPLVGYRETRIVGINTPRGKWTRLVAMTQLKHITNIKKLMGEKFSSKLGFWQMTVRAQSMSEGKGRSKGR